MLREDNTGFVNFPLPGKVVNKLDVGKTFIYLVAFDTKDQSNIHYDLSNTRLNLRGSLVSDDISIRNIFIKSQPTLDDIIEEQINNNEFEERYFPNILSMDKVEFTSSIPLTTCICLGWDDFTYEYVEELQWVCTFRDLTSEGRKLYYSIKKLHNNKEVRILTFNNI